MSTDPPAVTMLGHAWRTEVGVVSYSYVKVSLYSGDVFNSNIRNSLANNIIVNTYLELYTLLQIQKLNIADTIYVEN